MSNLVALKELAVSPDMTVQVGQEFDPQVMGDRWEMAKHFLLFVNWAEEAGE